MLRNLNNVEIVVEDWQAAKRWYVEKLDLILLREDRDDRWCLLSFPDGGCPLAIWEERRGAQAESDRAQTEPGSTQAEPDSARAELDRNKPSRCIPIILVNDLEATVKELEARGVEFTEDIRKPNGYRITTLLDCEGNRLQLKEYD